MKEKKDYFIHVNDEKFNINDLLRKYYITSFSLKDTTRKDVEELFANTINNNHVEYGGNIDGSTTNLINMFLPHQTIIAKKVHALLSLNNDFINMKLASIFKKGYNRLTRLRGNSDEIDIYNMLSKSTNDIDVTITIPAFIYYEYNFTKNIGAEIVMEVMELYSKSGGNGIIANKKYGFLPHIINNLLKHEYDGIERLNKNSLSEEDKKKALKRFNNTFGFKLKREMLVDEIIRDLELNAFKELEVEKNLKVFANVKTHQSVINEVYKHPKYRDFKRLSALPYTLGKDELNLATNSKFTLDDYYYFYYLFLGAIEIGRLEDTEKDYCMYLAEFLMAVMYNNLFNLIEKELEYYEKFRISLEKDRMKIEENTEKIKEEKVLLSKEKEEQKLITDSLENKNKQLLKECEDLKRKLSLKEIELLSYKNIKDEVNALRNEIFSNSNDINEEEDENGDVFPYKIAYFGGHPNTIQKLRKSFYEVKHIPPESLSVDLSFAKQMDFCIFDTTYNNHSNYKRFKEADIDTPVIYVNNGTGISTISRKIKEILDK